MKINLKHLVLAITTTMILYWGALATGLSDLIALIVILVWVLLVIGKYWPIFQRK